MEKMSGKCCIHIGRWLCSIVLVMSMVACDDALDNKTPDVPSEKEVSVELSFGFANEEDGYTFSGAGNTRSENALQEGGFSAQLIPNVDTRATADLKPDALYELHVIQYKQDGTLIKMNYTSGTTGIGAKLTYTLTAADDCQLVIVARGMGNISPSINSNLANVQKLTMDKTIFENIPTSGATQEEINKMPYVLHLEHVNVTSDGKLQSIEGAHDARLLLKRLATKLTVNWKMSEALITGGYALKEVKLCQVPATFSIIPSKTPTEWGTTYPSEVSEFVEFYRLTDAVALSAGAKTVWIPANVRGTSARATSPYYRTKENAPTAASYMELVLDNSAKEERLYYRAYLGGMETTDFNLYENKDYHWTLAINSANYREDSRIQLLDQTPVTSSNLVETSNSFMMQPGTNICFNPYKHEAGTNGWNDQLVNNPSGSVAVKKTITTVKVLWQTKDAGTSGELVLGYVIGDTKHENLVNIVHAGDINQSLVSIKVPQTKGGNAVIAAYDVDSKILWSWHIWVTDYVPTRINNYAEYDAAQKSSKNGTVHKWDSPMFHSEGVYEKKVLMDRSVGAKKGGFPGITIDENFTVQDVVNTYGLLYQWGRKDPFPTSADGTTEDKNTIFDGYGIVKTMGLLASKVSIETSIQNPITFYAVGEADWCSTPTSARWNSASAGYAPGQKTIYDPCPAGWKMPMLFQTNQAITADNIQRNSIATNFGRQAGGTFGYNEKSSSASQYDKFLYYLQDKWIGNCPKKPDNTNPKGGRLFLMGETSIDQATIYNSCWFGASSERNPKLKGQLTYVGCFGHIWCADYSSSSSRGGFIGNADYTVQVDFYFPGFAWDVRCIQK